MAKNEIKAENASLGNSMLEIIERAAKNPEVDLEKMDKLLNMQERIMERQGEMDFNADLANLHSNLPTIVKSGQIIVNDEVRSTYAKFEDILEAVRPVMKRYGFAMTFKPETTDRQIKITGMLMHRSGHREEASILLPLDNSGAKNAVQAVGSTVTYGKRYVFCSLLNIATGDDDDGMGAELLTADQVLEIAAIVKDNEKVKKRVLDYVGVEALHLIPKHMFGDIKEKLDNTKAIEQKDG